jgi:RimJ/RimL family protein N-acetyltransferase
VVYSIATGNLRSQRAFEKMGARREGSVLLYSSRLRRDVEHFVYRIVRSEWEERRRHVFFPTPDGV